MLESSKLVLGWMGNTQRRIYKRVSGSCAYKFDQYYELFAFIALCVQGTEGYISV